MQYLILRWNDATQRQEYYAGPHWDWVSNPDDALLMPEERARVVVLDLGQGQVEPAFGEDL